MISFQNKPYLTNFTGLVGIFVTNVMVIVQTNLPPELYTDKLFLKDTFERQF